MPKKIVKSINTANFKNDDYLEIIFVLICFSIYFTWSLMQPYNSCPDEYMRFDVVNYIFHNLKLPLGQDPSIRNSIWGISYGFEPVLPAIIGSIFMKLVSIFTMDKFALLMGARMVSILSSVGTVIVTIKISKCLFNRRVAWIFVFLVSLLPQFAFVSTYVNNDSLAIFSTALIVYYWISGQASHWKIKDCIGLAVGLSVCALSYFNAYGFILMSVILFFWSSIIIDDEPYIIRKMLKNAAIITGVVFLFAGWWFIRNLILYNELFAWKVISHYSQLYAIDEFKPSNRATPSNLGYSLHYMLFKMKWLESSYYSFIGKFGYMSIGLKSWMYWIYDFIFASGIAGLLIKAKQILRNKEQNIDKKKIVFYSCMFISGVIPIVLSIIYSYYSGYQPQGRYWLPMLLPFMYFITKGIQDLSNLLKDFEGSFLYIIILAILLVVLVSCFNVIPRVYC